MIALAALFQVRKPSFDQLTSGAKHHWGGGELHYFLIPTASKLCLLKIYIWYIIKGTLNTMKGMLENIGGFETFKSLVYLDTGR